VTREEIAMKLFDRLERECPGLIHSYDCKYDEERYEDKDLAEIIIEVCAPWSRQMWAKGVGGFELKRRTLE
jgi:hypothetical protein